MVIAILASGCASTPADRIVYNSVDAATSAVEAAVDVFNAGYTAGKFTNADRDKVAKALEQYRVSMKTVVHLARNLQAADYMKLVNQAVQDALAVINQFKVK